METMTLKTRQAVNAWFKKNFTDIFDDTDEIGLYGRNETEQIAYLLKYLEEQDIVVALGINVAMAKPFFINLFSKGQVIPLPKNCATPGEAYKYGIEFGLKTLENGTT